MNLTLDKIRIADLQKELIEEMDKAKTSKTSMKFAVNKVCQKYRLMQEPYKKSFLERILEALPWI